MVVKSRREGRIIHLRTSKAIILTEELADFDTYEPVEITLTSDQEIIIKKVEE